MVFHKTIKISHFEVVYGFNPPTLVDLLPLSTFFDFVHKKWVAGYEIIKKLHEWVKRQIQQ